MRITESHLRKIIRNELIKENMTWKNLNHTMNAVKSALLAAGITLTPAAIQQIAKTIEAADTTRASSYNHYLNLSPRDKAIVDYHESKNFRPSGPPSHHGSQRSRNERKMKEALEVLEAHGVALEDVPDEYKKIVSRNEMYRGDVTFDELKYRKHNENK
jgi:predicted transcriptional regulator YheO